MKLINIYNDNLNQARAFSGYLDDDLQLQPNSKIDLISADIDISQPYILIEPGEFFEFATQAGNVPNKQDIVFLEDGQYTATDLIKMLMSKMNAALDNVNDTSGANTRGFQWNVSIQNNKLILTFGTYTFSSADNFTFNITNPITLSADGKTITRKTGTPNNWNGYAVIQRPFINGVGEFLCTLSQVGSGSGVNNQNFVVGIINGAMPGPPNTDLSPSEYTLALTADNTESPNGKYQLIINGVVEELDIGPTLPQNDDEIMFALSLGKMTVNLKPTGDTDFTQIYEMDWEAINPITKDPYNIETNWVCASLYGANTAIEFNYIYQDPFITSNVVPVPSEIEGRYWEIDSDGNWTATNPKVILIFPPNSDISRILGFKANQYSLQASTGNFNAEDTVKFLGSTASSILVQLNNLQLESYNMKDSVQNRQNILKILPFNTEGNPSLSNLVYISPYKQAIDINNNQPLNLRRLDITLLDAGTNERIPFDSISLAIAVYGPNE